MSRKTIGAGVGNVGWGFFCGNGSAPQKPPLFRRRMLRRWPVKPPIPFQFRFAVSAISFASAATSFSGNSGGFARALPFRKNPQPHSHSRRNRLPLIRRSIRCLFRRFSPFYAIHPKLVTPPTLPILFCTPACPGRASSPAFCVLPNPHTFVSLPTSMANSVLRWLASVGLGGASRGAGGLVTTTNCASSCLRAAEVAGPRRSGASDGGGPQLRSRRRGGRDRRRRGSTDDLARWSGK